MTKPKASDNATAAPAKKAAAKKPAAKKSALVVGKTAPVSQVKRPGGPTVSETYSVVVKKLAKDHGVKVGAVTTPPNNPYRRSAAVTGKVMRQAGILTKAGHLAPRFK
jgi:hypothetical protein